MLKSKNLQVYNYFTIWKLNTFTDKRQQLEMKKSRIMNRAFDCLTRKYHSNLKAGLRGVAKDSWCTNMQRNILNKLTFIAFGKVKAKFDIWKLAIPAISNAIDHKKAKVIDLLI